MHPQRHFRLLRVALGRLHAGAEEPRLAPRLAVDAPVDEEDDDEGDVEGAGDGEEHVSELLRHLTHTRVVGGGVLPAEERSDRDGDGQNPHEDDDERSATCGQDGRVLQGSSDADVAVNADDTQTHDGRRAAQYVHGGPHVTEQFAKQPRV